MRMSQTRNASKSLRNIAILILPIWLGIIMMAIGTGLQFSFAVNQKIFPKTMPDSLRYRLEKRKSHAAGV